MTDQLTRRRLLQATAVGGVGLGTTKLMDAGSAADTQPAPPLVGPPEQMLADSNVIPESGDPVAGGRRLLTRLADDGLLQTASYDALPADRFTRETETGVYRVVRNGVTTVGFRLSSTDGLTTVVFSDVADPVATVAGAADTDRVWYLTADGDQYRRLSTREAMVAGDTDTDTVTESLYSPTDSVSSPTDGSGGSCTDSDCSGYGCMRQDCDGGPYLRLASRCQDGDCVFYSECC